MLAIASDESTAGGLLLRPLGEYEARRLLCAALFVVRAAGPGATVSLSETLFLYHIQFQIHLCGFVSAPTSANFNFIHLQAAMSFVLHLARSP